MARQSGKNELSAQIETVALITGPLLDIGPITCIKVAPTFDPQARISLRRLDATLRAGRIPHRTADHIITVGPASCTFLSAEPTANIAGHTANPLLEIDEAQDVDPDKYDRDIAPFASANNATRVFYGTAWSEDSLLNRELLHANELQRADGIRRVFLVPWNVAATVLPTYRRFVEDERSRLGAQHPLFTTQYELTPLPGQGRLLSPQQLAQIRGTFPPTPTRPTIANTIAAGLDLAGSSETPAAHDLTVLTFAAVTPSHTTDPLPAPSTAILHVLSWQNAPLDSLLPQIAGLLKAWRTNTLAVDATGLGEHPAQVLTRALPHTSVLPIKFTQATKSAVGYQLQAAASTRRLRIFEPDGSPDSTELWRQLAAARAEYLPSRLLRWSIPEREGHDDHLVSLALCNHAAQLTRDRTARGR